MRRLTTVFRLFVIAALFAIAGCGGGDGGGSKDAYSVSPTHLTFTAIEGSAAPAAQISTIRVNAVVYLYILVSPDAPFTTSFDITGQTTGEITVTPVAPLMAPGTYTGTITVVGCADCECTAEVAGSPKKINVSYTVQPRTGLKVDPASLAFSQVLNGTAPGAQTFSLSDYSAAKYSWNATIAYQSGSDWLRIDGAATSAGSTLPATPSVSINPVNAVGTYAALIHITGNGRSVDVPVTYTVSQPSLTVNGGPVVFAVGPHSTMADIVENVDVGDTGGNALPWSAHSPVPWLVVGAESGVTGGDGTTQAVSLSLVPEELAKLDNGVSSTNVTFTYTRPDGSTPTLTLPVTVNLAVPRVDFVAPYVAVSSHASSTVTIRGQAFTGLTASDVMFGSNLPTSLNVVSDTEMKATIGSLAAQSYPVTVNNDLGMARSRANLVVVDPQTYSGTSFASAGQKKRIIFDDERRAVYVVNSGAATIERYTYDALASGWTTGGTLNLPKLRDAALTPDGTSLVTVSENALKVLDPDALVEKGSIAFSTAGGTFLRQIAFANSGVAIVGTGYYGSGYTNLYKYDMLANSLLVTPNYAYVATVGGAADGSRIIIGTNGISPAQPIEYYNASTGAFAATAIAANLGSIALSRSATAMVVNGSDVYDQGFVLKGGLPAAPVVLSPDGAYAYSYNTGTLHKYDLNGALVAGLFPEVGSGTPVPGAPITSSSVAMAISLDGNTIVVGGDSKVAIMPAP